MGRTEQSYPLNLHLNNINYKLWDNLMPVIEKISSFDINFINTDGTIAEKTFKPFPRTFGMKSEEGLFMFRFNVGQLFMAEYLIDCAHEAVLDFIINNKEIWDKSKLK